ncbi:hypothetical protein PMI30_00673 [Pseudomonas sp. GM50]|nr:hypothetical protein PMI30_00673 [Pseudomonas sp. GM50]
MSLFENIVKVLAVVLFYELLLYGQFGVKSVVE